MSDNKIVNTSVANIYESHAFKSQLVTQALLWEKLDVYEKKDDWYKIRQKDGYMGWIHDFYIIDLSVSIYDEPFESAENWYWVKDKFKSLALKDHSNFLISFGSLLPCFEDKGDFVTYFPDKEKITIDRGSLLKYNEKYPLKDIIPYVLNLIGIPYLWGGKSSFGFDCSGLIQIIYQMAGYLLPRDCSEQVKCDLLTKIDIDNLMIGNLVYFKNNSNIVHVGMFINKFEYIHSSGCVKINSINSNHVNYDDKLYKKIYGFYKLKMK